MKNLSKRAQRDIIAQYLVFTTLNYSIYKVENLFYLEINSSDKFIILDDENFNDDEIKKLKKLTTNEKYEFIKNKINKNKNIYDGNIYKHVNNLLFNENKISNTKFYVVVKNSRSNMSSKIKVYTIINNNLINLCVNEKTNYKKVDGFGFNRIKYLITSLLGYNLDTTIDYTIIDEFF